MGNLVVKTFHYVELLIGDVLATQPVYYGHLNILILVVRDIYIIPVYYGPPYPCMIGTLMCRKPGCRHILTCQPPYYGHPSSTTCLMWTFEHLDPCTRDIYIIPLYYGPPYPCMIGTLMCEKPGCKDIPIY